VFSAVRWTAAGRDFRGRHKYQGLLGPSTGSRPTKSQRYRDLLSSIIRVGVMMVYYAARSPIRPYPFTVLLNLLFLLSNILFSTIWEPHSVPMNVAIFWDIAQCIPIHLLNAGFWSGSFFTLKMEVIRFSEMLVHIGLHGAISQKMIIFIYCSVLFCSHAPQTFRTEYSRHSAFKGSTKLKTKLHGLSPRANYTDRATAACRRSDCQLLRIEGATWSAW
jgi:hypothetical protein